MKRPRYQLRGVEAFKGHQKQPSTELQSGEVFAVRKEATGVEAGEGGKLSFILSTATPDRSGDVVAQSGWYLENYRKNPVVLWAHDQGSVPVAKAPNIVIEDGKLKAKDVVFADYEFAQLVKRLYEGGFMSAVSVGFLPRKWNWNEERGGMAMDFLEQELLEFSCVPVPANPEALVGAKSAGIDVAPVLQWAEKLLDSEGSSLLVPREYAEAVHKHAKPARLVSIPKASEAATRAADEADDFEEDKLCEALAALTAAVKASTDATAKLTERAGVRTRGMDDMEDMDDGEEMDALSAAEFVRQMIPHHEAAIEMAEAYLRSSEKDEQITEMANAIIKAQKGEIEEMRAWQEAQKKGAKPAVSKSAPPRLAASMSSTGAPARPSDAEIAERVAKQVSLYLNSASPGRND